MDISVQFVLFVCIAVSSFGNSILAKSFHGDMLSSEFGELEDRQDDFPEEFFEKIISEFSPEERERYMREDEIADRDGNTDCSWYERVAHLSHAPATDVYRTVYYIVNAKKEPGQAVSYQICNYTRGFSCNSTGVPLSVISGTSRCCKQESIKKEMSVIPVPKEKLVIKNKKFYLNGEEYNTTALIQKELYIHKSRCGCDEKPRLNVASVDVDECKR